MLWVGSVTGLAKNPGEIAKNRNVTRRLQKLADKINDEEFLRKMEELGGFENAEESDPDFQANRFKQTLKLIHNAVGKITFENAENMERKGKAT